MSTMQGISVGKAVGLVVAFLFISMFVLTARHAAKKRLSPKDIFGVQNKRISRWEFGRSVAGLCTIVAATYPYRGANGVLGDTEVHVAEVLVVGVISVLGCMTFAMTITRPRGALIAGARRPLSKMAWTFAPLILGGALLNLPAMISARDTEHPTITALFVNSNAGPLLLLTLWVALFALWALYYSARFLYCPGEVHPLLAPLTAIVAVGAITGMEIARANNWLDGLETALANVVGRETGPLLLHPAPQALLLTLTISGWVTTTGFAVLEWRSISNSKGPHRITLREVPDRMMGYGRQNPGTLIHVPDPSPYSNTKGTDLPDPYRWYAARTPPADAQTGEQNAGAGKSLRRTNIERAYNPSRQQSTAETANRKPKSVPVKLGLIWFVGSLVLIGILILAGFVTGMMGLHG